MTAVQLINESDVKPVYSPKLICHHPTSSNPEVLKEFALAMLRGEGYYFNDNDNDSSSADRHELYEELLAGERILMMTVTNAEHTGISVVSTKSPVKYFTPSITAPGDFEEHSISLFVAIAVTNENSTFQSLLDKIQSWDEDPLLTDRIGQATFDDVWANISGEKNLPKVASEYVYHKFTNITDQQTTHHLARICAAKLRKLDCRIEVRNVSKRTKYVNAKSFTSLLSLGLIKDHIMEMRVLGDNASDAIDIVKQAVVEARKSKLRHMGQK